jgi:hypothetical protein
MGCVTGLPAQRIGTAAPEGGRAVNSPQGACAPTDQDAYVYRSQRLQVIMPCVRATGTLTAMTMETDGDMHMVLRLDPPDEVLLWPANLMTEAGGLVIEPVCQFPSLQAEAIRVCASDPDPYHASLPPIGAHVWMEGRYVLDLQHHGWAELHPLYRWGFVNP